MNTTTTATETRVQILGGIEVIGGSVVLVSTPNARVILDFGMRDLNTGLLQTPGGPRRGHELVDLLRAAELPVSPGLYDPAQLASDPQLAASTRANRDARPTAVFLSHAHIDHEGALGFLDPSLPLYASEETTVMLNALRDTGEYRPGHPLAPIAVDTGETIRVGDLTVELIPVDHDIPGACGVLVTAPDGSVVYTGDLNFHRDGGMRSHAFAERIRGVDLLVTETTMLSFDHPPITTRSEAEIEEILAAELTGVPGLVLMSAYPRDAERAQRLIALARTHGRELVWPSRDAALLAAMGVSDVTSWASERAESDSRPLAAGINRVTVAAVAAEPGHYLVQPDGHDAPALADLPIVSGSTVWVHSQGEPLGPFMPDWEVFQLWLQKLGIAVIEAGSTGHALGHDLLAFVEHVAPGCVLPIHGKRPEALTVSMPRVLPRYGDVYLLDGTVVGHELVSVAS
ncbi:MBL fold metallo-hydrolase [Cryobacterium melibiosiphilum]|uniref:MBL fold metallo-hydrolase n=1 Tax=Cryobacterium melibiosiphilum TaxID=995039 RepID=A0A3A5MEU8_9MICO|nr:MBL fold metallo-hydrolase [Cryobacterium melibiosiphilum]RJT87645.1 MBL fold metallo-hydrolase [Cryobacterium melibiosiphilum]